MAVVLITGCNGGVGLLSALEFAREGDRVFAGVTDSRLGMSLERSAEAEGLHGQIEVLTLDITSERSVLSVLDRIMEEEGRLDVLVNATSVVLRGAAHLCSDEEARWQFDHDVFGMLRMVRAVIPIMKRQGRGAIVNIGAVSGHITRPYRGAFAAAKHAVEALTQAMHFELSPFDIRVVMVEPGRFGSGAPQEIRLAAAQTDGSFESDAAARYDAAVQRMTEGTLRIDPNLVARAVRNVTRDQRRRLRHQVGYDDQLLDEVYGSVNFEDYEETMRKSLDWWD